MEVCRKPGGERCGKLGGALRANKMLRMATHTNATRHEIKPPVLFRISRTSDMYALYSDSPILPPFELPGNAFSGGGRR